MIQSIFLESESSSPASQELSPELTASSAQLAMLEENLELATQAEGKECGREM